MEFTDLVDHRVKIKENDKRGLGPCQRTKELKLWNIKVTVIPIITGSLGTVSKGLVKGLEELEIGGRAETI